MTFGSSTIHHQNRAGQSRTGGRRGRRGEKKKKERHHEHDEGGSESCQKMHLNCKLFNELRFVLEAILILQTTITWNVGFMSSVLPPCHFPTPTPTPTPNDLGLHVSHHCTLLSIEIAPHASGRELNPDMVTLHRLHHPRPRFFFSGQR